MRRPAQPLSFALLLSAPWALMSLAFAEMAALHWRALFPFGATICGHGQVEHCGWCYAAVASAAAALASFVLARGVWAPSPAPARI